MKIIFFWNVALYGLVKCADIAEEFDASVNREKEMLMYFSQTIWPLVPEDIHLHSYCCENL
jgi:hypothetical protein